MRQTISGERGEDTMRIQVDRALARAIPVRQRQPYVPGALPELGRRRYLVDGEVVSVEPADE
jgi:hypothetical protein